MKRIIFLAISSISLCYGEDHLKQAWSLYKEGKPKEALALCKSAELDIWIMKGFCYGVLGDIEMQQAIQAYVEIKYQLPVGEYWRRVCEFEQSMNQDSLNP